MSYILLIVINQLKSKKLNVLSANWNNVLPIPTYILWGNIIFK